MGRGVVAGRPPAGQLVNAPDDPLAVHQLAHQAADVHDRVPGALGVLYD
jgi:hypothetical protein